MSQPIIIGIDHGYAAMKTAHCSFPTGLVPYLEFFRVRSFHLKHLFFSL